MHPPKNDYFIDYLNRLYNEKRCGYSIVEDWKSLCPYIDHNKKIIYFSNSTAVYIALSQFSSVKLSLYYVTLIEYAAKCKYEESLVFLENANKLLDQESINLFANLGKNSQRIKNQVLFLTFHEEAHGVFNDCSSIKESCMEMVIDNLFNRAIEEIGMSRLSLRLLRRLYWGSSYKSINDMLNSKLKDPNYKLEIACDIYALFESIQYFNTPLRNKN